MSRSSGYLVYLGKTASRTQLGHRQLESNPPACFHEFATVFGLSVHHGFLFLIFIVSHVSWK